MNKRLQKLTALLLALAMTLSICPYASAAGTGEQTPDLRTEFSRVAQSAQAVDPEEWVTVVVELKGETTLDVDDFVEEFQASSVGFSTNTTVAAHRVSMVDDQSDIQTQIAAMIPDAQFRYHYTNLLNGFAARVQYKDIETIKSIDGVLDVYMTQQYDYTEGWEETEETVDYMSLEDYQDRYGETGVDLSRSQDSGLSIQSDHGSVEQMGLEAAWEKGYTGAGKTIAIFDSSLRHTHELFNYMDPDIAKVNEDGTVTVAREYQDSFKTKENLLATITANESTLNLFDSGWGNWFHQRPTDQQGFSKEVQARIKNGEFYHNLKVPFAVDYMDGDLEVWDENSSSHGTHVAGITAGNPGPFDENEPISMDNVNGVLGGAYDSQILFFKVFSESDDFGQEGDEAVFAALDDAVTLGVNGFNLSLGIRAGFTTANTYAQAGYQKAYNRAAAAGISIAVSAGNDARSNRENGLFNSRSTLEPNSKAVGFSGSLFGPMTAASAQGTGYITYGAMTTMTLTNGDSQPITGVEPIAILDRNQTLMGTSLPDSYEVIDCGAGTEAEILAATGKEELAGALEGKIALVQQDYYQDFIEQTAPVRTAQAKGMIVAYDMDQNYALSASQVDESMPTFGAFKSSVYDALKDFWKEGGSVKVSFTSQERVGSLSSRSDSGPSSFTSWGVTEALKLKPDIMAPGGNIWSAGASSDTALSVKSGTSMASPNMAGVFLLVQQYVDDNLETFKIEKGTQAYTNVVNWLAASNATVYQPFKDTSDPSQGRQNVYFSPRRQGAGMANIEKVINSKVVLHNTVPYNPDTGEAPRTKVELGDKLGDVFTFSFVLENYNNASRTFEVLSCLQTDATTDSAGRPIVESVSSTGADIDPIEDAVMTVDSVSDGASIDTPSANVNRYAASASPAKITVPANSSVTVTIKTALNETTMAAYNDTFPNGMFLEGFVFFDSVGSEDEDVSIPFMGFRGDWTDAPIFDLATIYDDISDLELTDLDYPLYYATAMATVLDGTEGFLGVNQFTDAEWDGYYRNNPYTQLRTYFHTIRETGGLKGEFSAISPNEDGYADIAYANLTLLRNAKALYVEVKDESGAVIRTMGPEFEYFEVRPADGNKTQQVAATYGTKYNRNMAWDGKNDQGQLVADGQYTYTVYAVAEKEFLENDAYALGDDNAWDRDNRTMTGMTPEYKARVLAALKASQTKDSLTMPVKVDTQAPELKAGKAADGKWTVSVSDEGSGVQVLAFYYDGERIGQPEMINKSSASVTLDIGEALSEISTPDMNKLELQAVDYAFNISKVKASEASNLTTVVVSEDPQINALPDSLKDNETAQQAQTALTTGEPSVSGDALNGAATDILLNDTHTEETAKKALTDAGVTVAENAQATIVVQTYLEISVKSVSDENGAKSVALDIAPKYRKLITINAADIKPEGEDKNAVELESGSLNVTKPVTVTVPLPAGFAEDGALYVRHNKGNKAYIYGGTVAANVLSFTNPNGFSEFVIGVDAPKAKIGDVGYESLQAAIDDAANDAVITLLQSDSATVSKTIVFTIQHGDGVVPTVNAGSRTSIKTETVEGGTKYICVASGSSGGNSSGGSSGGSSSGGATTKPTNPSTPATGDNQTNFTDVPGHWAEEAINAAVKAGLFNGTSATTFSPNVSVNRAMFATILYRLHKEPAVTGVSQFPDAVQGSWYYNAVIWAAENNVVLGMQDGTFAPNQAITREQMAAMLYRYATYAGHNTDTIQPLTGFADKDSVSSWAEEAMSWAVAKGYIAGKPGDLLDPKGLATRAEAATILMRFLDQQ